MPEFLPDTYAFSHEYAVFLNDIIVALLKHGHNSGIFETAIELEDQQQITEYLAMPYEAQWKWLVLNGHTSEINEMILRGSIVSLLLDFSHFVGEALSCCLRGKITVAFSLLRKPFKDNLFYLEWLLADPAAFIAAFHQGPKTLEKHLTNPQLRFPIIEAAFHKTTTPRMVNARYIDNLLGRAL